MVDRIADVWGDPHAVRRGHEWPARVDSHLAEGSPKRTWTGGCSRPACCAATAAAATSPSRTAGWSASAGAPSDTVNHGRLGPKGLYGSARPGHQPRPADASADARGRTARRDRLGHRDGPVVERSRRCWSERGPLSHGFYTSGQLFLEEYYTLGVIGKAGLGTPHMDGNTRLCTATAAAAMKETFGADGQPGTLHRHRALRRDVPLRPQHGGDRRRCCGRACSTATRGPGPAAARLRGPARARRSPRGGAHGGVHLAVRAGHQPGADERPDPRADRQRLGRRATGSPRTPSGSTSCARTVGPYTPEAVARDLRCRRRRRARAARIFGDERARALHRAAGLLPVAPGDGGLRAGEQPAPAARDARPAGARHPADERPAHRAEQPRVRRRRRPARLPQLGQPRRTSQRAGASCGTSTRWSIPHWAPPTHAMQIFRYVEQGSIELPVDLRDQPGRLDAASRRASARILEGEPASSSCRTCSSPRPPQLADVVLPAAGWGEKTGHLHQRQPDGAPVREGGRAAGRGPQRPRHLPRRTPPRWTSATTTARR